jgi:RNA polymerase sigma-70 factor (ECF subfamily)
MSLLLKGVPEMTAGKTTAPLQRPRECRELFANLSDYLDARIEPRTCEQMREHIEACPACIAFLRDLRAAIDRCRSFEVECDPNVSQRIRALMTQEYLRLIGRPA